MIIRPFKKIMGNRVFCAIKKIIPIETRDAIKRVMYRCGYHYSHEKCNQKMVVVFLINRTNIFSSVKSLFLALQKNEMVDTYIIALPDRSIDKSSVDTQKALRYCKELTLKNTINSWNKSTQSFFDIKQLNPDFIFLATPYEVEYPDMYGFPRMASFSKLCFVPYGMGFVTGVVSETGLNDYMLSHISYLFADSIVTAKYCEKRLKVLRLFGKQTVCNMGFARFDLIRENKRNEKHGKLVILYTPRWSSPRNEKNGHEPSSFMLFKDYLLDFAEKNPEIDFVIRPHPILFDNYISEGIMTKKEVEEYRDRIKSTENFFIDETSDYLPSLLSADILLSDYSSIISEYMYSGKPVVYFGNDHNYADEFKPLFESMYVISEWSQAQIALDNLLHGMDPKKEQRDIAVQNCLKENNQHNVGQAIAEYLVKEYNNSI